MVFRMPGRRVVRATYRRGYKIALTKEEPNIHTVLPPYRQEIDRLQELQWMPETTGGKDIHTVIFKIKILKSSNMQIFIFCLILKVEVDCNK